MNLIINSLFVFRIVMFGSVLRDSLPESKKVVRRESVFLKQFTVKIINTKEDATFILWTKDSGGKYELWIQLHNHSCIKDLCSWPNNF